MTEEEKQKERELKISTAKELPLLKESMFTNARYKKAFDTDERLVQYVTNVIDNPDAHNLYELLSIKRFFYLLDNYEIKPGRFRKFSKIYEALSFKGKHGSCSYKLTPIQAFMFFSIYAFVDADNNRLTRDAYIFVPRKFSKTTQTAAMAVYDFLFGDYNSQAYCAANSYKQAQVLFSEIKHILKKIDSSKKHFRINREVVTFENSTDRASSITCLASNPDTLDGLNASFIVCDEYAKAKNSELKDVLTSSMGNRLSPLTVVITTGSDELDAPFFRELNGVKAMLRGEIDENPRVFASLFMPDVDDKEDDPAVWAKVQPHLNVTVNPTFYEEEFKKTALSSDNLLAFRTKLLNIFYQDETASYISRSTIDKISVDFELSSFVGRPAAMCAVDLSESDDFSAITIGVYSTANKMFRFHTAYFFPKGALAKHPNRFLYERWAEPDENGNISLILTEGNVIDYSVLVKYILKANEHLQILAIGYDNWKSHDFINMLAAAGASNVLKPVSQTYGTFTAPVQAFEHGVETGHIYLNNNPINKFCFGNAVLDYDSMQNCKPVKRGCGKGGDSHSNMNKIDGVITTLMCMRLFIDYER